MPEIPFPLTESFLSSASIGHPSLLNYSYEYPNKRRDLGVFDTPGRPTT